MAVELTRKAWRRRLAARPQTIHLPPSMLAGLIAAAIAIALTSSIVEMHNAQQEVRDARERLSNAQQLLALPPAARTDLAAQLAWARGELAAWRAQPVTSGGDPASDTTTALLVRHAQAAGLTVRGISRVDPATTRLGGRTYDVHGTSVSVSGTLPQVAAYLADMRGAQPALFPTLIALTLDAAGAAQAQLAFKSYALPASATPTPPAVHR